jgi:hypothetical protein
MVGGGGIRTCDLRFIRRGSQPIELPLGDTYIQSYTAKTTPFGCYIIIIIIILEYIIYIYIRVITFFPINYKALSIFLMNCQPYPFILLLLLFYMST